MILFVDTDIGKLIYNFHSFKISNVEFFQKSQFRASEMTNIADYADLMKLQNLSLHKILVSQSDILGIFNAFKCGIFFKNKDLGPLK